MHRSCVGSATVEQQQERTLQSRCFAVNLHSLTDIYLALPWPQVRELELNMDMKSVANLMDFLEKVRTQYGAH